MRTRLLRSYVTFRLAPGFQSFFFFFLIDADGSRRFLASFSSTVALPLCVVLLEFYMDQRQHDGRKTR